MVNLQALAAEGGPGMGTRLFGVALAVLGLLAVGLSLYLRFRPRPMSAKPYRPPAPPYGPPPETGTAPGGDPPTSNPPTTGS